MKYRDLKTIYHMYGKQHWENEYNIRYSRFTSYKTNINIHPIQDEKQKLGISFPLFFCNTEDIFKNTETILLNSKKIDKFINNQPFSARAAYVNKLLVNELQSTNEKENVRSTKEEIAEAMYSAKHTSSNKRFVGLVKQYLSLFNEDHLEFDSIQDFRSAYDLLLYNEIKSTDQPDGILFRASGVGVHDESTNKWIHRNEFKEAEISEFLNNIINFINFHNGPQLIKIVASHYMFEYLHPFYDGNGRLGRFILAKLLSDYSDVITALTFSYTINRNREKYDKAFEKTSNYFNKGELTSFIDTMLKLIIEGQESAIEEFEENAKKLELLSNRLKIKNLTSDEVSVFTILLEDKIFGSHHTRITVAELVKQLPFGRQKTNKILENHLDKLIQIKKNPVIYELKDSFIEELLSD